MLPQLGRVEPGEEDPMPETYPMPQRFLDELAQAGPDIGHRLSPEAAQEIRDWLNTLDADPDADIAERVAAHSELVKRMKQVESPERLAMFFNIQYALQNRGIARPLRVAPRARSPRTRQRRVRRGSRSSRDGPDEPEPPLGGAEEDVVHALAGISFGDAPRSLEVRPHAVRAALESAR